MEPFTTLDEIKNRLDWELDADEERVATAAIEDASDLARDYGRDWMGPSTCPRTVITLVRRAVTRHMKNTNGYTQSRAGDETLMWADDAGEHLGDVYFTEDEQKQLARLAGKGGGGLVSVGAFAYNPNPAPCHQGYVPTAQGKPFPMFESDVSPW